MHAPLANKQFYCLRPCTSLQLQVPPFEHERFSKHVGSAVHFTQELVIRGKVVDKGAVETQWLQQRTHLSLQGTGAIHLRPKRLGNAQILTQHNHVHLQTHVWFTRLRRKDNTQIKPSESICKAKYSEELIQIFISNVP